MMNNVPPVKKCDVTECCYNRSMQCHAAAIQVGDDKPLCDTFTRGNNECGVENTIANVGACKVNQCAFNNKLECTAPGINVGHRGNSVECLTYKHR